MRLVRLRPCQALIVARQLQERNLLLITTATTSCYPSIRHPLQVLPLFCNQLLFVNMKTLILSLLVGACVASIEQQVPLQVQEPQQLPDPWTNPLKTFKNSLKSLTKETRAVWDEVSMMYPGAMDQASFFSTPKKHNRRPDSHWDHIIRGADVQSVWVENENGEQERDIDGKLNAYDLRAKNVNPGSLGVDPKVKQYSGYLDDNENDKHLFYCMFPDRWLPRRWFF